MRNLLLANFNRLFKNRLFWLLTAALLAYSAWLTWDSAYKAVEVAENFSQGVFPEMFCYDHGPVVLMIIPVFVSLFLGTEFSDGTMRNKIIVGNRRVAIYLSDMIAVSAVSLVFCAAWHIGALTTLPILGLWRAGISGWLLLVLKSALFCVAFAAVLCLVSHIITNKATVAVVEIVLTLAVIMAGSLLYNRLLETDMVSGGVTIMTNEAGETVIEPMDPHPNPDYIAEPQRTALKRVLNALPSGQAILLANVSDSEIEQLDMPLYSYCASVGIIAVFTAAGLLIFRKKDLK